MRKDKSIRDFLMVDRVGQIGMLAHQDRLAILRSLVEAPKTGAEIGRELGRNAARIHYHLAQLLEEGLIVEVGKGRKRWKEERFYRTVARHFVMDPRVGCQDPGTSNLLVRSIESTFLAWRREEILKIDLAQVAHQIVQESLMARAGENILVMHGSHGFDLAELVHVELQAIGCRVHSRLWSYHTVFGTLDRHTPESLQELEFIPREVDEELDGVIYIGSNIPEGKPPTPEQLAKLPLLLGSLSRWQRSLLARRVRYVEFVVPFRREFEQGKHAAEEAISTFWKCIRLDHGGIQRRAQALLALMGDNARLRIRGPGGTDLSLDVEVQRSFVLDGRVSPEDAAEGRVFEGLPAGTLNFFPVPGSAHGVYRGDYTFHGGMHIEGLLVRLSNGEITEVDAPKNAEVLRRRMEHSAGDAGVLSGIRFGLSPAGRGPTGMPMLDACLAGTVTLHFGNNELQGGDVRSTFDLTLPACRMTVESGNQKLVAEGVLADAVQRA